MISSSTESKEIRRFGAFAFLVFGMFSAIGFRHEKLLIPCFLLAVSGIGLGMLLLPSTLRPVYAGWLRVSQFIGKTTTIILLALAYYLVITPAALLKRLFGGRPIPLSPDRKAVTYWVSRSEPLQSGDRFQKRY